MVLVVPELPLRHTVGDTTGTEQAPGAPLGVAE
jgi:hypothetical protein